MAHRAQAQNQYDQQLVNCGLALLTVVGEVQHEGMVTNGLGDCNRYPVLLLFQHNRSPQTAMFVLLSVGLKRKSAEHGGYVTEVVDIQRPDHLLILDFSRENSVASEGTTPVAPEWTNPLEFNKKFCCVAHAGSIAGRTRVH